MKNCGQITRVNHGSGHYSVGVLWEGVDGTPSLKGSYFSDRTGKTKNMHSSTWAVEGYYREVLKGYVPTKYEKEVIMKEWHEVMICAEAPLPPYDNHKMKCPLTTGLQQLTRQEIWGDSNS